MSKYGTFGVLTDEKGPLFTTLEPPDKNNKVNESCIPEGHYICKRDKTGKYNDTFEVTDVQDRTEVEFHSGNYVSDTKGCILIGSGFDRWDGEPVIEYSSQQAFEAFMKHMEGVDTFALVIENNYLHGAINRPVANSGEAPA